MGLTAKKIYAILNGKIKELSGDISGLGTPLFYAGSVLTADLLPLSPKLGAVYNIEQKSVYGEAGTNVAWNGTFWDSFGASFDASLLLTREDAEKNYQPKGNYLTDVPIASETEIGGIKSKKRTTEQIEAAIDEETKKIYVPDTSLPLDDTLTKSGYAADAKIVGNRISNIEDYINAVSVPMTWRNIQNIIAKGYHKKVFKIGDKLTSIWSDPNSSMKEYNNPLRINHFQDGLELENGKIVNGMWLQTQYIQLKGVQFSHQRAFLRCPDGLVPGTYYFTIESTWGNNVSAGDIVCFTTTQTVPIGGRISGCYGAPDQTKDKWKIYTHSADGKEIIETITPTFEASGTDLGLQKLNKRNGNLNSTQEMAYGWNRWKTSAIRQYLNSDKPKEEWWVAQDEWDIAPDQLNKIDGYLKGIDTELLEVIQPVKCVTYTNTVNDGGEADITYDKVILPSLQQMYINPQIQGEGEIHQYYKELNGTDVSYAQWGTYAELITYAIENHASAQNVRLRSAHRAHACNPWFVSASGYVSSTSASYAYRFAPLVFIGASSISAPTDAE